MIFSEIQRSDHMWRLIHLQQLLAGQRNEELKQRIEELEQQLGKN